MTQPTATDHANAARLREMFELVRLRVARLGPGGGEVTLSFRVERLGRIGGAPKLSVEEFLALERQE